MKQKTASQSPNKEKFAGFHVLHYLSLKLNHFAVKFQKQLQIREQNRVKGIQNKKMLENGIKSPSNPLGITYTRQSNIDLLMWGYSITMFQKKPL